MIAGASQEEKTFGFWGPVCVNHHYIHALLKCDQKFVSRKILPLQRRIDKAKRPQDIEKLKLKREILAEEKKRFELQYKRWGLVGYNIYSPTKFHIYPPHEGLNRNMEQAYSIETNGTPYKWSAETIVDLESTATALQALASAAENSLLPERIATPYGFDEKELIMAGKTVNQLKKLTRSLIRMQLRNGCWSSFRKHFTHAAFVKEGVEAVEVLDEKIPQQSSVVATIYACSALESLAVCLGSREPLKVLSKARSELYKELGNFIKKSRQDVRFYNLLLPLQQLYSKDHKIWRLISQRILADKNPAAIGIVGKIILPRVLSLNKHFLQV